MHRTGPTHRDGPLAFVHSVAAPVLDADDRHHLARVLRVRDGDEMVVCDGAGAWRRAVFGPEVVASGPALHEPVPSPPIAVGFALTKGDRPELVVQKLTELGVDRIVPFTCDRSVVRWDDAKAGRRSERLRRIAREASMQCRRTHLPVVDDVTTLSALLGAGSPVVLAGVGGDRPSSVFAGGDVPLVAIGPEGGWSAEELALGLGTIEVGVHILRAETAAIAAATLLAAARAGLVT